MRHHFKWYLATQVLPEWKQRKQVTEERRAQGPRTCWEAEKREGQVGQHLDRGVPWTQPRGVALGHGADWIQGILFLPDPRQHVHTCPVRHAQQAPLLLSALAFSVLEVVPQLCHTIGFVRLFHFLLFGR